MKTWTTKEGETIKIKDMTDGHLMNTIRYIKRKAKEGLKVVYCYGYDSEHDYQTGDVDILYGKEAIEHIREYKYLRKEAKSRNLIIKKEAK